MSELSITVRDIVNRQQARPVAGGVPLAQGVAPQGCSFLLTDDQGQSVPLQTGVLARWPDGSARWVLLDFCFEPTSAERTYTLSALIGESPAAPGGITRETGKHGPILSGAQITIASSTDALLQVGGDLEIGLTLVDEQGQVCTARADAVTVEAAGPVRGTLDLRGAFYTPDGERVFQCRLRASLYAGLRKVRLEPLILVDAKTGIVQRIKELNLEVRSSRRVRSARLGGPNWEGKVDAPVRLFQRDDAFCEVEGTGKTGTRAPGWAEMDAGRGTVAVALRDFWQQWPKSLEASSEGLSVGLFPRFTKGTFDHMEPWYKHQYLFSGECYQLRTGQARRWDVWLDLEGEGASLGLIANKPLLPVPDPTQAIASGVWGPIPAAGSSTVAEYDGWAGNMYDAYCRSIAVQKDYGAMNWGDWFGERRVNWGNHEYDTTHQLLIQYARTGEEKYFYTADTAARHSSEVDTVHFVNDDLADYFNAHFARKGYPPRAGMVHQHAVGHVGGFYPVERIVELFVEQGIGHPEHPYTCLDPFNMGHVWTQGMVRHYFLTGDPFLKETVERIGKNLAQLVEDREYPFMGHTHCGRTTGWPLLALGGAYEIDLDERFLNAMRTLADDALQDQDPVCGGWLIYPMAWDHCLCKTARHTGMAGFITAVLINGLSRYHDLSGDERLPEAIDKAVTFLDNDTWREEWHDWRYTSCPATKATGQPGVVMMAHVNGARIAGNAAHRRVLSIAWQAKFERLLQAPPPRPGQGKAYTASMYGCAETVGLLVE